MVSTTGFHPVNVGSIPAEVTTDFASRKKPKVSSEQRHQMKNRAYSRLNY